MAVGLFVIVRPIFRELVLYIESFNNKAFRSNLFAFTICIVFLCAWTTALLGLDGIFGAFLFGLVVPRDTQLFHDCNEHVEAFVLTITLPLYFAISGLKTDISQIRTGSEGAMVVLVCAVATGGKFLGAVPEKEPLVKEDQEEDGEQSIGIGIEMETKDIVKLADNFTCGIMIDCLEHLQGIMDLASTLSPNTLNQSLDVTITKFEEPSFTEKDQFIGLRDFDQRLIQVYRESTDINSLIHPDITKPLPTCLPLSMLCKTMGATVNDESKHDLEKSICIRRTDTHTFWPSSGSSHDRTTALNHGSLPNPVDKHKALKKIAVLIT
eukprot:gene21489-27831_t